LVLLLALSSYVYGFVDSNNLGFYRHAHANVVPKNPLHRWIHAASEILEAVAYVVPQQESYSMVVLPALAVPDMLRRAVNKCVMSSRGGCNLLKSAPSHTCDHPYQDIR
jgi:hypothetical protein